jgi:hypothetical protein
MGEHSMLWFMRVAALAVVLGFSLPLVAQDAKKPDADKKADDTKPDDKKKDDDKDKKDKLLPAGTLQGKITKLDADKKTMSVEVTIYFQKLNTDEYKGMLDAQSRYNQAFLKRPVDVNGAAQAQRDYVTHYGKLYSIDKKTQELDLQIIDDAKIRVSNPPIAFDDDGKVKKYTKAQLDKLKGDPKLPGYPADFDALATGEMVQVQLVKKKDAKPMNPNPNPNPGAGGAAKPKEVVGDDALADHLPLVQMVVVIQTGENK